MVATKVTLLFNCVTKNSAGQAERTAGFSESYYSTLDIKSAELFANWQALCIARANLMPQNVSIIGSRYQQVDPIGGSRQYDNKYPPSLTTGNDLPGMALQWTVRSDSTPNQRNLILRGTPDIVIATGEYSPSPNYGAALTAYFRELRLKWQFRAIDRAVLPLRIVQIVGGIMTTVAPHGLVFPNTVNIMSTFVGTDPGTKTSYQCYVISNPTPTTAVLGAFDRANVPDSRGGKVRRVGLIYPYFSITNEEIQSPTAIHRKAGAPFKKFRGRRTARR